MFWKSTTSDAVAANELECSVSFCMHRINLLDLNSLWIYYEIILLSPVAAGGVFVIVTSVEVNLFKGVGRLGLR